MSNIAQQAYAVLTKFTAKDDVTTAYKRMNAAADAFHKTASKGARQTANELRHVTKEGYRFGTVVKGILAADAIRGGINLVRNGLSGLVTDYIHMDDTLIGAAARFRDIGTAAVDFDQKVVGLRKGTRDAVLGTKFSASQASDVMNELAKADFTSAASLGVLRSQLQLASATNTEFAESIEYSNRLLGAFGLRSSDDQKQIASHIRLNDMLGKASNIANGNLATLFETLKTAAPVGSLIGTTPEEMIAMGLAIDKAGIDASMAATSLKRAILNIGSADVQKELAANGIAITDNMGKFRKLSDILTDIGGKVDAKGLARTPELTQIFDRLFGKYGLAGVIGLIKNIDAVKEYEDALRHAAGANREMDEQLKKGLGYRLGALKNQLLEFGFRVLDAFEVDGKRGIEALSLALSKIDPKSVIDTLRGVVGFGKGVWSVIKPLIPYIPALAKAFFAWKLVMLGMGLGNFFSTLITGMKMTSGMLPMLTLQFTGLGAAISSVGLSLVALTPALMAFQSATTGKDNLISRMVQAIGIVPKLQKDITGKVTGYAPDAEQYSWWRDEPQAPAPNAAEARAQRVMFSGRLDIAGAPAGSSISSKTTGAPKIPMRLLGAN